MAQPQKKLFGNLSIDGIKDALAKAPEKKTEYKGENQLKVNAVEWEDGGISISLNYKDAAGEWQRINLGNLRVSTLDSAPVGGGSVQSAGPFDSPF